jgi:hypothetical protein
MSSGGPRLGHVEPRERVGAQTGRKYEYQYERTARAALDLLAEDAMHVCVYCDWHDDYVTETGQTSACYVFHQVKGRKSSQGPWKFTDFFGVKKKESAKPTQKTPAVSTDAIVPRMLLHHQNFGDSCAGLAFVTNAGLDAGLSDFLQAIGNAPDIASLPADVLIAFKHVEADLFTWLRGLAVHTDRGQIEDQDAALLELADVVVTYSEIDLLQRQAKQISRDIISQVRRKVAHSTTVVPASDDQLRRDKGLVVTELLGVLSLSTQAYEQLKAGQGRDTVKTLSRLQRFCEKHGMTDHLVQICEFKAFWDTWRTTERHFVSSADFMLLEKRAYDLLATGLTLEKAVAEAKDIAKQFHNVTATPLTPEHVMGLIFSLAAQTEATNYA